MTTTSPGPAFPDAQAYSGCRVLVAGGAGFLGLNLLTALADSGASLLTLQRGSAELPGALANRVDVVRGDLRDARLLEKAIDGCDVIFHLAGRSGATASTAHPLKDLEDNVQGTLRLLETCRTINPGVKIVFPSSRLVYRVTKTLPVPETARLGPLSIYAEHKHLIERYLGLYRRTYGLRSTVLRITNPYGPFQPRDRNQYGIINWFVSLALADRPIPIYGTGDQLRDYVHVDDVSRAFLKVGLDTRADGQTFNVGSGEGTPFVSMAKAIVAAAGGGRLLFEPWPPRAAGVETGSFVAAVEKIRAAVGWTPTIRFSDGVTGLIDSYLP